MEPTNNQTPNYPYSPLNQPNQQTSNQFGEQDNVNNSGQYPAQQAAYQPSYNQLQPDNARTQQNGYQQPVNFEQPIATQEQQRVYGQTSQQPYPQPQTQPTFNQMQAQQPVQNYSQTPVPPEYNSNQFASPQPTHGYAAMPQASTVLNATSNDDLENIKKAGFWVKILGWVLFVLQPISSIILMFGSTPLGPHPLLLFLCILMLPAAAFLVYSGKYIQNLAGNNIRTFIIVDAIISVLFMAGIFPSWVLYKLSKANYGCYNLKKSGESIPVSGDSKLSITEIVLLSVAIGIGIIVSLASFFIAQNSDQASNNKNITTISTYDYSTKKDSASKNRAILYESTSDGFKVDFNGTPLINRSSLSSGGQNVPYVVYHTEDSANTGRALSIMDMSNLNIEGHTSEILTATAEEVANTLGEVTVQNKTPSTFLGVDAIDIAAKVSLGGEEQDLYVKSFIKNKILYNLFTVGESKSDFDEFASSFQLTR